MFSKYIEYHNIKNFNNDYEYIRNICLKKENSMKMTAIDAVG